MKKLKCNSCGSSDLRTQDEYYICEHCLSRYPKKQQKNTLSKRTKIRMYLGFFILNILALVYYLLIYDKAKIPEHRPIKPTQSYQIQPKEYNKPLLKKQTIPVKNVLKALLGAPKVLLQSKDRKYLYALVSTGGFQIFSQENDRLSSLGSFVHRPPREIYHAKQNGNKEILYDAPKHLVLSKDENTAYISDTHRGFYILDISDKSKPKLLARLPKFKIESFVLSADEKEILTYSYDTMLHLDVSSPQTLKNPYGEIALNYLKDMQWDKEKKHIFMIKSSTFSIYSLAQKSILSSYKASTLILKMQIDAQNNTVYLLKFYQGMDKVPLGDYTQLNTVQSLKFKNNYQDFYFSSQSNTLYLAHSKGLKSFYLDPNLRMQESTFYKSESARFVSSLLLDEQRNKLFIGYSVLASLALVDLEKEINPKD